MIVDEGVTDAPTDLVTVGVNETERLTVLDGVVLGVAVVVLVTVGDGDGVAPKLNSGVGVGVASCAITPLYSLNDGSIK